MPIRFTATLEGHPWDLWGLSRLFDGSNSDAILVVAKEPVGLPRINMADARARGV
jgi:hypothetical protein